MSKEGGAKMKKDLFAKQSLNTLSSGTNSAARRACGCKTCSCGKSGKATIKSGGLAVNLIQGGV